MMKMNKHIEVVAAVIKQGDKYFCAQRQDKGELAKKWEFPGGKIEKNETKEAALIREIKEELNSTIKVLDFLITVEHHYKSFDLTMHVFMCEVTQGSLEISEHLDSKWLLKSEMSNYDFAAADLPIIDILD